MSMLLTVLLIVAASSMSAALIRQAQVEKGSAEAKTSISGTRRAAETLLTEAELLLQGKSGVILRKVMPLEADRNCLAGPSAGTSFSSGSTWPESCGTVWTYSPVDGEWAGERIEYRLPSASNEYLTVTARVRFQSGFTYALTGDYIRDTTGKVSLAVADSTTITDDVNVTGGLYAYSVDTTDFSAPSVVAAEETTGSDRGAVTYSGGEARQFITSVPSPSSIAGAAQRVQDVACGVAHLSTATALNTLCLVGGEIIEDTAGNPVTIPASAAYYLAGNSDNTITVSSFSAYDPAAGTAPAVSAIGTFYVPENRAVWVDGAAVLGTFDTSGTPISLGSPDIYLTSDISGVNGYHAENGITIPAYSSGVSNLAGLFSAGSGLNSLLPSGTGSLTFEGTLAVGSQVAQASCGLSGVSPAELCGFSTVSYTAGEFFTGAYWGAPLGGELYRVNHNRGSDEAIGSDWIAYSDRFASWNTFEGLINTGRNDTATLVDFEMSGNFITGKSDPDPAVTFSPRISGLSNEMKTVIALCTSGQVTSPTASSCASQEALHFSSDATEVHFNEGAKVLEMAIFAAELTAEEINDIKGQMETRWQWVTSGL